MHWQENTNAQENMNFHLHVHPTSPAQPPKPRRLRKVRFGNILTPLPAVVRVEEEDSDDGDSVGMDLTTLLQLRNRGQNALDSAAAECDAEEPTDARDSAPRKIPVR